MRTTITARHCEIPETVRARAVTVLERAGEIAPRAVDGHVVFDLEGNEHRAEVRLHLSNGEVVLATGDGTDHRTALDRAEDKIRRQLKKAGDRPRRGRKPAPDKV